jgi:septal ring factor EnvC (AmiA/AmiB activator)
MLKKGKAKKLEKIEEEEERERQRLLEEEWELHNKQDEPEMVILKELDASEFEKVQVYDGDLNPMTFNHVKRSKAFDTKLLEVEEDLSWLATDLSTTLDASTNEGLGSAYRRSEDGWNKSY